MPVAVLYKLEEDMRLLGQRQRPLLFMAHWAAGALAYFYQFSLSPCSMGAMGPDRCLHALCVTGDSGMNTWV